MYLQHTPENGLCIIRMVFIHQSANGIYRYIEPTRWNGRYMGGCVQLAEDILRLPHWSRCSMMFHRTTNSMDTLPVLDVYDRPHINRFATFMDTIILFLLAIWGSLDVVCDRWLQRLPNIHYALQRLLIHSSGTIIFITGDCGWSVAPWQFCITTVHSLKMCALGGCVHRDRQTANGEWMCPSRCRSWMSNCNRVFGVMSLLINVLTSTAV